MRRLPIVLVVLALAGAACSDDDGDDTSAEATTTTSPTTTLPEPDEPSSFCDGFAAISFSLDEITRTMVATMNGEEPGEFILVLDDAVETMAATAELAPTEALGEQARLVATTYAGFEELLLETEFDVAGLPADDARAAALADPALAEAIGAMNDHCADLTGETT